MMPHVDEFRPVHNLASLADLVAALAAAAPPRQTMARWQILASEGGSG